MKKYLFYSLILAFSVVAQAQTPLQYLQAMVQAHQTRNYEQLYLKQQGEEVTSLRYRHAYSSGREYAQLLHLDDLREEVILRDDKVSYFGDFQPFSLRNSHIVDNLPSVLCSRFSDLKGYHFVDAGRGRIADRLARIIRIVPQDDFRYQYVLWIDVETNLLLRSDLLDRDNTILEQFRVLQNSVSDELLAIVEPVEQMILPTFIETKINQSHRLQWQPQWVPTGFKRLAQTKQHLPEIQLADSGEIESQLYSDGLFSFTIYVLKNQGVAFDEQFWREGKTSIYSQTLGENDVVIIGEIPLVAARHIAQDLRNHLEKKSK